MIALLRVALLTLGVCCLATPAFAADRLATEECEVAAPEVPDDASSVTVDVAISRRESPREAAPQVIAGPGAPRPAAHRICLADEPVTASCTSGVRDPIPDVSQGPRAPEPLLPLTIPALPAPPRQDGIALPAPQHHIPARPADRIERPPRA